MVAYGSYTIGGRMRGYMEYTVWVTNECNLRCNYCYVQKEFAYMKNDTAYDVVNFIYRECQKDEKIVIGFHGGEPLINFNIIKLIVMELKDKENIQYLLTTNGTLITDDIAVFISRYLKNGVSVSIDGTREVHDYNRKDRDGIGTYNAVLKSIKKLNDLGCSLRLRMTITPDNVSNLFEGYCELMELSCQNQVVYIPDIESELWTQEKINLWNEQEKKIFEYMWRNYNDKFKNYIENLKSYYLKYKGICSATNRKSYNIDWNGRIYPCIRSVGRKEFMLGNVHDGLNKKMVDKLQKDLNNEKMITNISCSKCGKRVICDVNRCKIISKILNGAYDLPSAVWCNINRNKYCLIKEYEEKW